MGLLVSTAREMEREPKDERGGRGREGGNANKQTPGFLKPCSGQRTGRLIGSASRTLIKCVGQGFVSYLEVVTRILLLVFT